MNIGVSSECIVLCLVSRVALCGVRMIVMSMFVVFFFFLMIRRPPGSTQSRSSAASDVYKRQWRDCSPSGPKRRVWQTRRTLPPCVPPRDFVAMPLTNEN